MLIRVYVAGALSGPALQYLENMRRMMTISTRLFTMGISPYCPCLDFHFALMRQEMSEPIPVQTFYQASIPWLAVSRAMLVLPGWDKSRGTQGEIEEAAHNFVPTFFLPSPLLNYLDLPPDPSLDVLFKKWEGEACT